jgi:hypothetical protein
VAAARDWMGNSHNQKSKFDGSILLLTHMQRGRHQFFSNTADLHAPGLQVPGKEGTYQKKKVKKGIGQLALQYT